MFRSIPGAVAAAAFAVSAVVGPPSLAAEPSGTQQDLGTFTCKEVMRLSGEDREIAIALAHGYVLGKKGTSQYVVETLAEITDQFIDYCLDHPTENALQSFEKLAN